MIALIGGLAAFFIARSRAQADETTTEPAPGGALPPTEASPTEASPTEEAPVDADAAEASPEAPPTPDAPPAPDDPAAGPSR